MEKELGYPHGKMADKEFGLQLTGRNGVINCEVMIFRSEAGCRIIIDYLGFTKQYEITCDREDEDKVIEAMKTVIDQDLRFFAEDKSHYHEQT